MPRGIGNANGQSKPASYPDKLSPPGTLGRMLVIQDRIARGESTTHPEDLKHETAYELNTTPLPVLRASGR